MDQVSEQAGGVRERKRLQTLERIAEVSLQLFVTNGYDETTLEAIAAAAGISRRTFFYYYKSKDEILVALQCEGFIEALHRAFDALPTGKPPIVALRDTLPELISSFESEKTLVIAEILQSTEALKIRKLAIYIEMENALFGAMARTWPELADQPSLRLMAGVGIGVLRLSTEQWRQSNGTRRLADIVQESFLLLERQFQSNVR
ncbi:MAG: helix-turn-helix domain-containing protein [Roseiarcus sp.]